MKFFPHSLLTVLLAATSFPLFAEYYEVRTSDPGGIDAYIDANTPDANHGSRTYLNVKSFGVQPPGARKAYLRFNLESPGFVGEPSVTSLTLTLTDNTARNLRFRVYALNPDTSAAGVIGPAEWDEKTITWNNAPANNRNHGFTLGVGRGDGLASELGFLEVPAGAKRGQTVVWTPAPEYSRRLQEMLRGALARPPGRRYLTLVLTRESAFADANSGFTSREQANGAHAPTLLLTVAP